MPEKKSRLPLFSNDEEERQFWSQHSFEEFADELEEVDVKIQPPPPEPNKTHKTASSLLRALPSLSLAEETLAHIESQVRSRRQHPARIPRF